MIALDDRFVSLMRDTLGEAEGSALIDALDTEPVTGVRLNPRKGTDWPVGIAGDAVPWCNEGLILAERPQFTLMPEWHAGRFYVQEPASMIISVVVRRLVSIIGRNDIRYLDTCAAPGGKTTAAISALPSEAFVVANEFVPARANILSENIAKWGAPNTAVCCGDTAAFLKLRNRFDIVAVDAPCSGEGMMRKDEEARSQWSESLVKQCAALQREIVANAWAALRPGGFLIYSTCTFNRQEDEDMLRYMTDELGGESVDLGIGTEFGIPGSLDPDLYAMRFMPHRTAGEGLFMGIMRKPGELSADNQKSPKNKDKNKKKATATVPKQLPDLLLDSDRYTFSQSHDESWRAIPKTNADIVSALENSTRVLSAGIRMGTVKGKNFIPDAALALSTALSPDAYPRVELDLKTALDYLRREAVTLPSSAPQGILLVTHNGTTLGFVKNLGNRANNLYPQHWRIRHL